MVSLFSENLLAFNSHIADPQSESGIEESALASMTLEQKVNQLFVFGFSGIEYHQSLAERLKDGVPGGIIVFHRNISSPTALAQMTSLAQMESLQQSGLPLLLMMDQEGGQVSRLKTRPPPPSALALGQSEDVKLVRSLGYVVGRLLDIVGINMNLAPVLDLSDPFSKSFIGNRSFGSSPQLVSHMSQAFVEGMSQAGVLAVAKHFPGHGGIMEDSHKGLTTKLSTKEELLSSDLIPFLHFSQNNPLSAMMVAHVSYPSLDPSRLPATYSPAILHDLLRTQLQYRGLVITDDLEMFGATGVGSIEERSIRALEAGADMVMVAWSRSQQLRARKGVLAAVQLGRLSTERIEASLRRIIRAKLAAKKFLDNEAFDISTTQKRFDFYTNELRQLSRRITKKNFDRSLLDSLSLRTPVDLHNYSHAFIFSADQDFYNSFKGSFSGESSFVPITKSNTGQVFNHLVNKTDRFGVFYASGTVSARLAQKIHPSVRSRVFIVNTNQPGLLQDTHGFAGVVHLHTRDAESGGWLARYLSDARTRLREPAGKSHATSKPPSKNTTAKFKKDRQNAFITSK